MTDLHPAYNPADPKTSFTLNPWTPMQRPIDLKHLGKLAEELGEAVAAVSRCLIQGIDEKEPVTKKPNYEWLEDELADVLANIELVRSHFRLDAARMEERKLRKTAHLSAWHAMLEKPKRKYPKPATITVSDRERECLYVLAEYYCPENEEGAQCLTFAHIGKRTNLTRAAVRVAVRSLTRKGLAEYYRGLWSEDGEPAGAGYCCTDAGFLWVKTFEETQIASNPDKIRHCRICKCSWFRPCKGGCWWVEQDLCSSCTPKKTLECEVVPDQ